MNYNSVPTGRQTGSPLWDAPSLLTCSSRKVRWMDALRLLKRLMVIRCNDVTTGIIIQDTHNKDSPISIVRVCVCIPCIP
jgi:hypothetical protein